MTHLHCERIEQAAPAFRILLDDFLRRAEGQGIRLLIVHVYRTASEQMALYKQGRYQDEHGVWVPHNPVTRVGIVTNAKPHETAHCVETLGGQPASCAADIIPVTEAGQARWDAPKPVWDVLYECASKARLDAYGDNWGRSLSWDAGHIELPAWEVLVPFMGLKKGQAPTEVA